MPSSKGAQASRSSHLCAFFPREPDTGQNVPPQTVFGPARTIQQLGASSRGQRGHRARLCRGQRLDTGRSAAPTVRSTSRPPARSWMRNTSSDAAGPARPGPAQPGPGRPGASRRAAGAPGAPGHRTQPTARAQDAGPRTATAFVCLRAAGGDSGVSGRPGPPRSPGHTLGRCPRGRRRGPARKGPKFLPGSRGAGSRGQMRGAEGPQGWGGGRDRVPAAGPEGPSGRRPGRPRTRDGRLTEIDVSERAAADLPAQPVPVPDSELHGGGGGPDSLLPSRPLPGSELGEAAPPLPLLRVRLPAPPPSRPRFHHRFPAAQPLPEPQYGADGTVRAPLPLLRLLPTTLALSPPRMDSDLPGLNSPSAA